MNTESFIENRRVYQREYMKARRAGENGVEVRAKEKEYNKIYKAGVGNEDYTCRCGVECKDRSKYSHFNSKRHSVWVDANPEAEQDYQESCIKMPRSAIKRFDKITCDCGVVLIRNNLSKHKKSIQHQDWVVETQLKQEFDPLEEEADQVKHLDDFFEEDEPYEIQDYC
jgi:hypothetical protein